MALEFLRKYFPNVNWTKRIVTLISLALFGLSITLLKLLRRRRTIPYRPQKKIICVVDFDGTFFKSPAPTRDLWPGNPPQPNSKIPQLFGFIHHKWYKDVMSLSPPFVPEKPSLDYYNQNIVFQIEEWRNNGDIVIPILLTGRNTSFAPRVEAIVENYNTINPNHPLVFAEKGFKPITDDENHTIDFKTTFLLQLAQKYQTNIIHIFEDRERHAQMFQAFIESTKLTELPLEGTVHKVDEMMGKLSESQERALGQYLVEQHGPEYLIKKTVYYAGVALDENSRESLLKAFIPPEGWTVKCEHMTIKLGNIFLQDPNTSSENATQPAYSTEFEVHDGQEVQLQVVGVGLSDKAFAVQVQGVKSANKIPHITIAVSPTGKPKDSNVIPSSQWESVEGTPRAISLRGHVKEWNQYNLEMKQKSPAKTKQSPSNQSPNKNNQSPNRNNQSPNFKNQSPKKNKQAHKESPKQRPQEKQVDQTEQSS